MRGVDEGAPALWFECPLIIVWFRILREVKSTHDSP
jgi:hypothetical protein